MKTLALLLTLFLHSTGLWSHLSDATRIKITSADTSSAPVSLSTTATDPILPGPLPIQAASEPLSLQAAGAYAVDVATGTPLFAQAATKRLPIASVTKLVTCLVILSRHAVD